MRICIKYGFLHGGKSKQGVTYLIYKKISMKFLFKTEQEFVSIPEIVS